MNDDLLIRFIDGKTTPEETEFVLSELSRDGDAAKEWMQMVQGARLADTKPAQEIFSDEFIAKTLATKTVQPAKRKRVVSLPWIISGITAVAASVAVIVTVMVNHDNTDIPQNVVAGISDTSVVMQEVDTLATEGVVNIKDISHEAIAEVVNQKEEEPKDVEAEVDEQVEEKTQPQDQSVELIGNKILQDTHTASVSESEASSLEIVRPAKSPYRVRVQNPEKEFVFEWKMSNASEVRFTITDKDGKVIIDKKWITESSYAVVASDLVDKGELDWTVEVAFNDGSMQRKTGKIELVLAK